MEYVSAAKELLVELGVIAPIWPYRESLMSDNHDPIAHLDDFNRQVTTKVVRQNPADVYVVAASRNSAMYGHHVDERYAWSWPSRDSPNGERLQSPQSTHPQPSASGHLE